MIKLREDKSPFLLFFLKKYFKRLLRKNFQFIFLKNKKLFTDILNYSRDKNIPVILCLNHSNWWDAPLLIYLAYCFFKLDGYCFMELKQLKEYPFFNKIGAIPIVKENIRSAFKSLNFAVDIAKNKSKVLAIFPQGELVKNSKLSFKLHSGLSFLIENLEKCILVLGYIDYRFSLNRKPNIYIDFFKHYNLEKKDNYRRKEFLKILESDYIYYHQEFELKFLNEYISEFETILSGKKSLIEKSFPIKAKVDSSLF